MRGKHVATLSLSAAALMMGGGGIAQADTPKFQNNSQILSCVNIEILEIPIASAANSTVDCSKTHHVEQSTSVLKSKQEYR